MNDTRQVSTLRQLRERKAELKAATRLSQAELVDSLGTTQRQTGDYLLKRIILPAGAVVVTAYVAKKLLFRNKHTYSSEAKAASPLAIQRTVYPEDYPAAAAPDPHRLAPAEHKILRSKTPAEEPSNDGFNFRPILSFAGSMAIPAIKAIYQQLNKKDDA
ncbi:hypothetical protein QWY85_01750 [Neolewinella lacunae]|uniref:Uncharacterized protein n=1 Tax=Neolewinella lacunae TaxID=1517758 RepID=A0A923PMJ5_9BACT|nr:hypothetical protein [Neolewinella lacunae]MBC6994426.1 hypothetical protein [Neolewinella lacunae]MDN3633362.1 hypothetical protein [Neolewinella lacunae]